MREKNRMRWESHVEAQEKSGLRQAEYCLKFHLNLCTFKYWSGKTKKSGSSVPKLIPIKLSPHAEVERTYCTIEYAHGVRIKIQSHEMLGMIRGLLGHT
jgi:hypothetical protein